VSRYRTIVSAFFAVVALSTAPAVWACPVCFGDPQSPQTKGMSMAILFLLGITGTVLSGFSALFLYFWKRGRKLEIENTHLVQSMMEASKR
jgi:hypothetical protein